MPRLESLDNKSHAEMPEAPLLHENMADQLRLKEEFSINPIDECIPDQYSLRLQPDANRSEACFEAQEIKLIRCDTGLKGDLMLLQEPS